MVFPVCVSMIFWSDEIGMIKPIRFRIVTDEGSFMSCAVRGSTFVETTRFNGNRMMIFRCSVIVGDLLKSCVLKYEIDSCKWFLFDIQ